jgi:oxidase EvaA
VAITRSDAPWIDSRLSAGPDHEVIARWATTSAYSTSTTRDEVTPLTWLRQAQASQVHRVRVRPIDELAGWSRESDSGNLVHASGRFFSVHGLRVEAEWLKRSWEQPIISQPEVGVLGLVVTNISGVLHCLVQTKMEPGNVGMVQLAPTVQATWSNYTGAHGGRAVPYLDYFTGSARATTLTDTLQSEQGSWFLRKRNRNVVVVTEEEVEVADGFMWMTVGDLHALLAEPNVLNMDLRTVLSSLPFAAPNGGPRRDLPAEFREALLLSLSPATGLHDVQGIRRWLTDYRSVRRRLQEPTNLATLQDWDVRPDSIRHREGRYFSIVGVSVESEHREVASWDQPMLEPVGVGRVAVVCRAIDGVLHFALQARSAGGASEVTELAPTVQCTPRNYLDLPLSRQPAFLDLVAQAPDDRIAYDTIHSEEGGRFLRAENRYQIIVADEVPKVLPEGFVWVTASQVVALLQETDMVNVHLRTLIAAMHTLW